MISNKDNKQFSIVYQITNLLDNRIYIGAHCTNDVNDRYMGSSISLKKDMKKLGKKNFKKDILFTFNNQEDMRKKEAELVTKEFCLREDTYNIMKGGIQIFTWIGTVVVKDKNGNTSRIYKEDPRYISGELVGIATGLPSACGMLGKKTSQETKDKISKKNKGKTSHNKGKNMSEEQKQKISNSSIGKIGTNLGKKFSEEHKEKIRQARLKR